MSLCRKISVIGTDTDVGKTVLSLLIMQVLLKKGKKPFYIKPFQTGCTSPMDSMSDAAFVYRHAQGLADKDPGESVFNCHENPKAPWFASRDMGESIDVPGTVSRIKEMEAFHTHLVIEAAGGLMVPLTEKETIADFLKGLDSRPVLAARAGLGTINHTLLTIKCLKHLGINPLGVVFMDTEDAGCENAMTLENIHAVEHFSGVPVAGVVGKITDFSDPGPACLDVVERLIRPVF